MKKQARESSSSMDRISGLPEHILHKIFGLLSEKEVVGTCVLSKSWRDIVSTRPNLVFRQHLFKFQHKALIAALDKTLHQRYHHSALHQNIQNFVLEIYSLDDNDYQSKSLLDKWIPIVFLDMGVNEFTLHSNAQAAFDVPWVVFQAKSLRKLVVRGCKLTENIIILCKQLRTLSLNQVHIADRTFHKIMSSCPLIESVTLRDCDGLRNIKLNKASSYNLNHFDISYCQDESNNGEDRSIEIDVPTIETISIVDCPNWYHQHNYFPRLHSLRLFKVRLSKESLDSFSCNFPSLQMLSLSYCYGCEDLRLFSPSIKRLYIWHCTSLKVDINAPNLLKFDYTGVILQSLSLTTNSSQWKSTIALMPSVISNSYCDASSWLHKLRDMLRALSRSEIYLCLQEHYCTNQFTTDTYGELCEPVYIGLLRLEVNRRFTTSISAFVDKLFRICRPRKIHQTWNSNSNNFNTKLSECMWKILVMERETSDYVWQQDLEEVSMEAFDVGGQKWNPVDVGTSLINCAALLPNKRKKLCFRLKWRGLS